MCVCVCVRGWTGEFELKNRFYGFVCDCVCIAVNSRTLIKSTPLLFAFFRFALLACIFCHALRANTWYFAHFTVQLSCSQMLRFLFALNGRRIYRKTRFYGSFHILWPIRLKCVCLFLTLPQLYFHFVWFFLFTLLCFSILIVMFCSFGFMPLQMFRVFCTNSCSSFTFFLFNVYMANAHAQSLWLAYLNERTVC